MNLGAYIPGSVSINFPGWQMRITLIYLLFVFSAATSAASSAASSAATSAVTHAAPAPGTSSCQADLTNLIVPDLKTPMNKKDISAELDDHNNGIYRVRLFVEADHPNRQVSIGWVMLDTNKRIAYDITRDEEYPDRLEIDAEKYKRYVAECLAPAPAQASQASQASRATADTRLPFTFDRYYRCTAGMAKADECADRIHAYPVDTLDGALKKQIDPSMDTVLFMPPMKDLKIVLAGRTETDVNIYVLYAFRNDRLVSSNLLGKMDGHIIQTFDISKDYLITTYRKEGTTQSKISNVTHLKLGSDGRFITCTNAGPNCVPANTK
jgi:hypothetical protein